jgi:septum formation protein
MTAIWLASRPLLLASKSLARRSLLAAAGIPFEAIGAAIDERETEAPLREAGVDGGDIARHLAREKALAISLEFPDRLVLGADQTLSLGSAILNKPLDREGAKAQLTAMSGRMHTLHAALCLAQDGKVVAQGHEDARLTFRPLSPEFIDCYLDIAGESVLQSVGGYALEGLGIHLFESIEGEQSTILGLPMLPLLRLLREMGCVEI